MLHTDVLLKGTTADSVCEAVRSFLSSIRSTESRWVDAEKSHRHHPASNKRNTTVT